MAKEGMRVEVVPTIPDADYGKVFRRITPRREFIRVASIIIFELNIHFPSSNQLFFTAHRITAK
jgi:hypothetical protein